MILKYLLHRPEMTDTTIIREAKIISSIINQVEYISGQHDVPVIKGLRLSEKKLLS